jgi:AsmA protein
MSRVLQVILGLVGLMVVLVIAAVIIIPLVVDPNDFRERIAAAVEEETGRSFEIEGEISLSVFPWLGLEVGRMSLGNPAGFGDAPFAEIASAGVGARLVPLLSRRLEISTLRLDGLRLNLLQLADGSNNWADLGDDSGRSAPAPAQDHGPPMQLDHVGGLSLTDAVVRYEDRQAGSVFEAVIPKLTTGELAPGRAFPLDAEALLRLDGGAQAVNVRLGARVQFADDLAAVTVTDLAVEGDADAAGGRQSFSLRTPRLVADLEAQTLAIPELAAELAGIGITADVTAARIVEAPALSGRLAVAEFSPRALLERLGAAAPDTADPAVLAKASLNARYQADAEQVQLEDLLLLLDDTTLSGATSIGLGEITRVRAQLALDAIDLDRYLPPEPEEQAPGGDPAEDVELAFDWLDGLDLDASFRADRMKVSGLTLTDLEGRAVATGGVLTLQPFGAALYGGQVRGTARLDARQAPATFRLEQSLSALQLLPFVHDLSGFERLAGVADLGVQLTTTASSTAGLMSGLNGELSFDVSSGALKGVNLWYEIQRANALARGRPVPQRSSADTEFRQLKGTAVIRDGLLVNEDLVGGLQSLGLAGRGQVNLVEATLDYRLTASVLREAIDEATGERSELAGASLPLRLRGSLDSPSVSVDLEGLARDRVQQEALQRLGIEGEDREALEEELTDRALDKVRSLRDRLRRND